MTAKFSWKPFKDEGQTHHVHDLLQREAELEPDWVRLVGHGALELLVVLKQVPQQPPLCRPAQHRWDISTFRIRISTFRIRMKLE